MVDDIVSGMRRCERMVGREKGRKEEETLKDDDGMMGKRMVAKNGFF